jgi:hypothetical protein
MRFDTDHLLLIFSNPSKSDARTVQLQLTPRYSIIYFAVLVLVTWFCAISSFFVWRRLHLASGRLKGDIGGGASSAHGTAVVVAAEDIRTKLV